MDMKQKLSKFSLGDPQIYTKYMLLPPSRAKNYKSTMHYYFHQVCLLGEVLWEKILLGW